ncbi:methyltransferase domain-containing protein [Pedobacter arcticus]|uniref:methyltransferase domain-containing protein n=1 Tax=Pedobacter arcticus TaxID=752140 RepID=UPI0003171D4C|nr:methyltransferase domain-containing protein [Pedobacter arcticus]
MNTQSIEKAESYDLLNRVGKKVLRPGGLQLTQKLLTQLNIGPEDDVVEFAPGLGFTASITLSKYPKSYTGIERDGITVGRLKKKFPNKSCTFIIADVAKSGLLAGCASKVYGEAMLTMHADRRKTEIIAEAYRLLKPGGLYGIHELGLNTDEISDIASSRIKKELAQVSHVNARPLSNKEWVELLEQQGFRVLAVETSEMLLLEPKRMLADEGLINFLHIIWNLITRAEIRERVFALRKTFKKHRNNLHAVAIVAKKL